jgi:hypothetical protein
VQVLADSNAAACGGIEPGDVLVATTGVIVKGACFERQLVPTQKMDFDTIMSAIGSNEQKWGCEDVVLQFKRA